MIRKLLPLFLLLAALRLFSQSNNVYKLLWKIEGNGLKEPSFLFGTMHVRDARAFNFSDSVMPAIARCSAFAMEIHPDTMLMDVFNGMLNDTGSTGIRLKEILTRQEYEKIDQQFTDRYGYSVEKLKLKNPFVIKSMLSKPKASAGDKVTFVDAYLLGIARTLDKTIYGLEKTKDQLDFFNSLSKENVRDELRELVGEDAGKSETYLSKLIDVYSRGDIAEIEREAEEKKMMNEAMIRRNHVMLNSMVALMRKNSVFTAVGVAHLPGKEGLLQLLKDAGYKVSPMPASFSGVAQKYAINPEKFKWQRYADSLNGFSITSPGAFFKMNLMEGLDMKFHFDLSNMVSYGYYAINMSGSANLNESEMLDMIINNYRRSKRSIVGKVKHLNMNGIGVKEITVKTGELSNLRLRLFVKNNTVYGLFAGGEAGRMDAAEAERFFNSFAFIARKARKNPAWITYSRPEGAFSIAFPSEPKVIEKEVPNEDGSVIYKLNMYMSTNVGTMTNYLIRYNDYPEQMYIDKNEKVFNALINDIAEKNKLVSGPDTIWQDGCEGRRFTCYIQNQYFTEGRIFLRGNRTYFLLKQNMVANSDKMMADDYFSSFSFEPYKRSASHIINSENDEFEITAPGKPKLVKDTADDEDSEFLNRTEYYVTNPNSGGLYHFESAELGQYFKVKSLSDYYNKFLKRLLSRSDSLLSSDSVNIDGFYGREYVLSGWKLDNPQRVRVWIAGNKLFSMVSYVGKDELFNEESNAFFTSFKAHKNLVKMDIFRSKADELIQGLNSQDTNTYKKALDALNYYEFEKTDLTKLGVALKNKYKDDSSSYGAKASLINAIRRTKDTVAFEILTREFYSDRNNDFIRASALAAIGKMDMVYGLPRYLNLLVSAKALKKDVPGWKLFSPLNDSVEFAREKFDMLIPLLDTACYRKSILQIARSVSSMDSSKIFLNKYFKSLFKNYKTDLAGYFQDIEDTLSNRNHSEIYAYLQLLEEARNRELAEIFTSALLENGKTDDYVQVTAIALRVKMKIPVNEKLLEKRLESLEYRYQILEAYEQAGDWKLLSSKYTRPEELGRTVLHSYISEDSDYPSLLRHFGKLEYNGKVYHAYIFAFEGEENKYLGLSGPFNKGQRTPLEQLYGYSDFKPVEKDWKEQARQILQAYE